MGEDEQEKVSFNTDRDTATDVEVYAAKRGLSKTKALNQLVNTGLRERKYPILYRIRDSIFHWAGIVAVLGLIAMPTGIVLNRPDTGYILMVVFVTLAVAMVAIFELVRVAAGVSPIGRHVRKLVQQLR